MGERAHEVRASICIVLQLGRVFGASARDCACLRGHGNAVEGTKLGVSPYALSDVANEW